MNNKPAHNGRAEVSSLIVKSAHLDQGSKKPGFFKKKAQPSGFLVFFGQAGKIRKIIQKLSNFKP